MKNNYTTRPEFTSGQSKTATTTLFRWLFCALFLLGINTMNAQLTNIPVTGFNNDVVANGTGTGTVMPGVTNPTIGIDGVGYTFIDGTYKWQSSSALPTCFMPASNLAASAQTSGLTYQLQSYSGFNSMTLDNNCTTYLTSPFPNSGTLSLVTPASYTKLYVLYESVVNIGALLTVDATITFTDATTQTIAGNTCVNWFTATNIAYNNAGAGISRAQNVSPGTPNACATGPYMFELPLALSASNYGKQVASVTITIPTNFTTGSTSAQVNYFHALAVGGLAACVAPADQGTALTQGATTGSSIAASFTAAGSAPSGYLVVGYPTGATPVTPVNGTTYTAGQLLGTGQVVQSNNTTSFTGTGLVGGTTYDVYVYSYNTGATCGGPIYNTSSPLMSSMSTSSCSGLTSATYPVGPTAPASPSGFGTLTEAFAYINTNGITGSVILELQPDYTSATETYPIACPTNACVGPLSSITVRPSASATALSITSANVTGTLLLSGARYITFDGRPDGTGTVSQLTIANTNVGASYSVYFVGDANLNTVKYCTLTSRSNSTTIGTVWFGAGVVFGNDGNTIDNCSITNDGSASFPVNAIYSGGTSAAVDNSGNSITNNNISNYFSATLASSGMLLSATGNSGWTITGNRLFQTANRTHTTAQTHFGISILSGSGYTINNNTIGFANAAGTGTTNILGITTVGTFSGTFPGSYTLGTAALNATRYVAINCTFANGGTVSNIQNNTIGGFALISSSGATTLNGVWCGININAGNVNIGTTTGNTIGASSGQSSVYVANSLTGGAAVGIYATSASPNTVNIQNNTIGAIDGSGTTATTAGSVTAIDFTGTANYNVSSNTIGNDAQFNIRAGYFLAGAALSNAAGTATSTTGTSAIIGVRGTMTGSSLVINNNTFKNWLASGTVTTCTGIISSGAMTGSILSASANNNALGTAATGAGAWMTYAVANSGTITGISLTNTAALTSSVQSNDFRGIIYNVGSTNTVTFIACTGGTAGGNVTTIANNNFTNLNLNTTGTVTLIAHSYTVASSGTQIISNNSIVTGLNRGGASGSVVCMTSGSSSTTGAVINHTNNNFSNITVTGTTTITGINNTDGLAANNMRKTVTGNVLNNWVAGTGAISGMTYAYVGSTSSISSNTITNFTGQGTVTGLTISASGNLANPLTVTTNTITGLVSNGTGGNVTGINCSNTSPIVNINNNIINTLNSTGASSTVVGVTITGSTLTNVFSNTINTLSGTGITSPVCNGISVTAGTAINIYKNKIYDIAENGAATTAAGAVNGMIFSGGTTVNAYNNLIGDLRGPLLNTLDAIRGIAVTSATGGTSYNVYDNTIYMNATSTGANFGTSGVFHTANSTATVGKLDLRNNIIVNTSTPTGTGITAVLRRSASVTPGNWAVTSGNNFMFVSSSISNTMTILNDGGSVYPTALSGYVFGPASTAGSYLSYASPRDLTSFTDLSFSPASYFQSTSGSDPNFLHMVNGLNSQVESGGQVITAPAITDDYDGEVRNVSTPDVGADEFIGVTPAPTISGLTVPVNTCLAGNVTTINATITTPSGTISSATINYNNGSAGFVTMTNPSLDGITWTGDIPAGTGGATVIWSITATNSGSISTTVNGTSYVYLPLTGFTASALASVNPICAGGSTDLTSTLIGSGPQTLPTGYGTSGATATTDDEIWRVQINGTTLNNSSTCSTTGGGAANGLPASSVQLYSNYTGTVPAVTLAAGSTYTGNLDISNCGTFAYSSGRTIFIDLNRNGVFDLPGERVYASTTSDVGGLYTVAPGFVTYSYSFTIPSTASRGVTLMRVSNQESTVGTSIPATGTWSWGETEDYLVNIIAAVPVVNSWFDGSSIVGTTSPLNVSPAVATTYTNNMTALGCTTSAFTSPASPSVLVNVTPLPSAPTTTASTQCGNGVPTASVTSTTGATTPTFKWYNAATGGTLLQSSTSTTYTTSISTTTTFYVTEAAGACESSPRTSVVVTVNAPDAVVAVSSAASICLGTSATLSYTQAQTTNVYDSFTWLGNANSGAPSPVTTNTAVVTPLALGTYTYSLTVSEASSGCVTSSQVVVSILPTPVVNTASASPATICSGTSTTLTGLSVTSGPQTMPTGYLASNATTPAADEEIHGFQLGTSGSLINSSSTCTTTGGGAANGLPASTLNAYSNYTAILATPTINTGVSYPVKLTLGYCLTTSYSNMAAIYVDLNRNGTFDLPAEQLYTKAYAVPSGSVTGSDGIELGTITIPANASPGVTLLRIVYVESSVISPTGTYTWGETEDYSVNITTQGASTHTWSWNPGNLSGNIVTANPTVSTTYTVSATNGTCTGTNTVSVTAIALPSAPTAVSTTQCGTGVPTASVTSTSGATTPTFKWYNAASGGTLLQTSTSTTYTATIASTTTFYVTEVSATGNCESSPRTSIIVTVNTPNAIVATSGTTPFCVNTPISLSYTQALSNNVYDSFSWAGPVGSGASTPILTNPASPIPNVAGSITYTLTATETSTGCATTSAVTVSAIAGPPITLATASAAGVCSGSPVDLLAYTIGSGPQTMPSGYLASNATTPAADEEIHGVSLGAGGSLINQTSTCSTTGGGAANGLPASTLNAYSNYTGTVAAATVTAGATYPFVLTLGYCLTTSYSNMAAIYVDLNRNGAFDLPAEQLYTKAYGVPAGSVTGSDGTASGSITIPSTASAGLTLMRIVYVESSAITPTGTYTWGETEDYALNIQANSAGTVTWTWNPGNINGNSVTAYPNSTTTFTVSADGGACISTAMVSVSATPGPSAPSVTVGPAQCGFGIPSTTSVASTDGTGSGAFTWYNAASAGTLVQSPPVGGALQTYYTNNFGSGTLGATLSGSAAVAGGVLTLQPAVASGSGGITVPASGYTATQYQTDFDLSLTSTGTTIADGFSYSFGNDADATSVAQTAEHGSGSKLRIGFFTYNAASGSDGKGIYLMYNIAATTGYTSGTAGVLAYSTNVAWIPTTATTLSSHVTATINTSGQLTLVVGGVTIFTNVQLPAGFTSSDKSTWKHVFVSRSGGVAGGFGMDNLVIQSNRYGAGYTTYQSAIGTTTTFYVSEVGTNGCPGTRVAVTPLVNQPDAIQANTSQPSICSNTGINLTYTQIAFGNSNSYTDPVVWTASPATGSGIPTSVSSAAFDPTGAVSVTPTAAGTYIYTATAHDPILNCATTATVSVLVSAIPSIGQISGPSAPVCGGSTVNLAAYTIGAGPQTMPTGYLASNATTPSSDEEIHGVSLGTGGSLLNQTSTCSTTGGGAANGLPASTLNAYSNYTGTVAAVNLTVGATIPVTLTLGYCLTTSYSNMAAIYIDLNRNGAFDLPAEQVYTKAYGVPLGSVTGSDGIETGTITIPNTASAGLSLMRVVYVESSVISPTGTYTWGETEDYAVNILSYSAGTYAWTWNPGNLSGNVVTDNPLNTTTYTVTALAGVCSSTNTVTVTTLVVPTPPTGAVSAHCGLQVPTAAVTSTTGATTPVFKWYNAATSGTLLQTSTSTTYTTAIAATTTFYVTEVGGICESFPRTPVTVTVTTPDPVSASVSAGENVLGSHIICGANNGLTLSTSQTGTTNVYNTYTWSATPATGSGIPTTTSGSAASITPTATGTYTYNLLATETSTGCITASSYSVNVFGFPSFNASATPPVICTGGTSQLSAGVSTTNFTVLSIPYQYIAIPVGAGVGPTGDDALSAPIAIPWSFNFFGQSYSSFEISTNGNIQFGPTFSTSFTPGPLPNTTVTNFVALGWADLLVNSPASIHYWVDGSAPFRKMVIDWDQATFFGGAVGNQNGQIWLYETTGVVECHLTVSNALATTGGGVKTLGVNNFNGTVGAAAPGRNGTAWTTTVPEAWRFSPPINYNFSWSPGASLTGGTTIEGPVSIATATTTYSVTITDPTTSCVKVDTTLLIVRNLPALPSNPVNDVRCGAGVVNLSISTTLPVDTAKWYNAAVGGTLVYSGPNYSPNLGVTTTFYVEAFNGGCINAGGRVSVVGTVNTANTASPTATPSSVCNGNSSVLAATAGVAGSTFSWSGPNLSSSSGSSVTASNITATTTYTVTATAPVTGCAATSTVTVNVIPAPVGSASDQTITSGTQSSVTLSGADHYSWTGSGNGATSGTTSTIAQTLTNPGNATASITTYTVTPFTIAPGNCPGTPFTVNVTVNPLATVTANNVTVCSGTSPAIAITASTGPGTTFTWTSSGDANASGFNNCASGCGTTINELNLANLSSSVAAQVTYTIVPTSTAGVVGIPFPVNVTINPIPVGTATNYTVCTGGATSIGLSSTTGGTTYTWTNNAGAGVTGASTCSTSCGSVITNTLTNVSGSAAQTVVYTVIPTANTCQGASFSSAVTVNQKNTAPTSLTATSPVVCLSSPGTILQQVGGQLGTGAVWAWYTTNTYAPASLVGTSSAADGSLPVSRTVTTTYWVRAEGAAGPCTPTNTAGPTTGVTISVTTAAPARPTVVSGPQSLCNFTTPGAVATYTATAMSGATSYKWTLLPGMTAVSVGTNTVIAVTSNTVTTNNNKLNITVDQNNFVNGVVYVVASNACGNSASQQSLSLTLLPAVPGTITGPASVCYAVPTTVVYNTTAAILSAYGVAQPYFWSVPSGMNITGGQGSSAITVDVTPNTAIAGNVTVFTQNPCGQSLTTASKAVTSATAALGAIGGNGGNDNICDNIAPGTPATFTVAPVAGATSYIWGVPAGVNIIGGTGTTAITLTFTATFAIKAQISVFATNGCKNTATVYKWLYKNPNTPASIAVVGASCTSGAVFTTPAVNGAVSYNWTVPNGMCITGGQTCTRFTTTTNTITTTKPGSPIGNVTVAAVNSCGVSAARTLAISCASPIFMNDEEQAGIVTTIYPNPTVGDFTIELNSVVDKDLVIEVYDVLGKTIVSKTQTVTKDVVTKVNTNIEGYKNGIYLVRIVDKDNNIIYTQSVVKQ